MHLRFHHLIKFPSFLQSFQKKVLSEIRIFEEHLNFWKFKMLMLLNLYPTSLKPIWKSWAIPLFIIQECGTVVSKFSNYNYSPWAGGSFRLQQGNKVSCGFLVTMMSLVYEIIWSKSVADLYFWANF